MEDREKRRRQTEIGWIIIKQMGGPRLIRFMTGAKVTVGPMPYRGRVRAGAEIALPYQANEEIDRVVITYDEGRDLYTMQGFSGTEEKRIYRRVYCDQLMDLFEEMTHLYLTLTPRRPMEWGGLLPETEIKAESAKKGESSEEGDDRGRSAD